MQKPNPLNIILFPQGHNPSHSRFKQKICKIRWTIHLTVRQHTVLNTAHICIWICMIRTGSKHWWFPHLFTVLRLLPISDRICLGATDCEILPKKHLPKNRWFSHLRQRPAQGEILQNSARKSLQVNCCQKFTISKNLNCMNFEQLPEVVRVYIQ